MPASIRLAPWRAALLSLGCGLALSAGAQSICSSDGRRAPSAVLERFIGADCEACWTASSPVPARGATVLDWIVPSSAQGDEAPLSAASTRDSLNRLQALHWPTELAGHTFSHTLTRTGTAPTPGRLRVAHGVAVADYLGVAIDWQPARGPAQPPGPWTAWLLLVERLPAGTEGSPIARQLVRNSLSLSLPSAPTRAWQERRAMRLPEGAQPERLALVGWLQDGRGRMVAINETVCENTPAPGSSR
jgi:hypothetical protein